MSSTRLSVRWSIRWSAVLLAVVLVGCHADVTFQFDVHRDGSVLATIRELVDDQFYKAALSQSDDPFGTRRLKLRGFDISTAVDRYDNHIITMSRWIGRDELKELANAAPASSSRLAGMGPISFSRAPGLFFDRVSLAATIPPLLTLAPSQAGGYSSGIASVFADSVATAHLEIRAPGKVLGTNGALEPDGFVRWDLSMRDPTTIQYAARVVDLWHVLAATIIAVLATVALALRFRRRLSLASEISS